MATVLYIQASPMGKLSASIAAADAFIEEYKKLNPADKIKIINIFDMDLPEFDFAAASAKYKIIHQKEHTNEDKQIWSKILAVITEFKSADKYVFAVPMWNFSIPWRLKQYIDVIVQPGQTFGFDSAGNYVGLVLGKKAVCLYARGGKYIGGGEAYDMQSKYFGQILGFMGIIDVKNIFIEPTLAPGADKVIDEAVVNAKKATSGF